MNNNHAFPGRWMIDESSSLSEQGKSLAGAEIPTFFSSMNINAYISTCVCAGILNMVRPHKQKYPNLNLWATLYDLKYVFLLLKWRKSNIAWWQLGLDTSWMVWEADSLLQLHFYTSISLKPVHWLCETHNNDVNDHTLLYWALSASICTTRWSHCRKTQ